MRIARRAVFVAVLLALLPTAAGAVSFVQVTDPNDVPGKLDLELVKGVRTASGQPITFTVRVQAPFAKTVLGPAANWVKVFRTSTVTRTSTSSARSRRSAGP